MSFGHLTFILIRFHIEDKVVVGGWTDQQKERERERWITVTGY